MRVFLEAVSYDVKGWIAANRPAWWTGSGTSTWDAMLPTNDDEFISLSATGGSGCYVGTSAASNGAPAYWAPAADLARVIGGGPRTYTQDELDTKVMNCFRSRRPSRLLTPMDSSPWASAPAPIATTGPSAPAV